MGSRGYRPSAAQQEAERLTAEKLKREEAALEADKRRMGRTRNQLVGASGGPAVAAASKAAGPGLSKVGAAKKTKARSTGIRTGKTSSEEYQDRQWSSRSTRGHTGMGPGGGSFFNW